MEELLKMLEELLYGMCDIEDINLSSRHFDYELTKDIRTIQDAIDVIKRRCK